MTRRITYPHRSRAAKAKYLAEVGGYSSRHDQWPLDYIVGVYMADLSFDHLWNTTVQYICDSGGDMDVAHLEQLKKRYRQVYDRYGDSLWEQALEDLRSGLLDSDSRYARHSTGSEIPVEFALEGRGGKHLVITRFDGVRLSGMSPDMLYDLLMQQLLPDGEEVSDRDKLAKGATWEVSGQFVTDLYCFARECEVAYTSRKASTALEESAAYMLYGAAEAAELGGDAVPTENPKEAARLLYDSLDMTNEQLHAAFASLCRAAGLSQADITF